MSKTSRLPLPVVVRHRQFLYDLGESLTNVCGAKEQVMITIIMDADPRLPSGKVMPVGCVFVIAKVAFDKTKCDDHIIVCEDQQSPDSTMNGVVAGDRNAGIRRMPNRQRECTCIGGENIARC